MAVDSEQSNNCHHTKSLHENGGHLNGLVKEQDLDKCDHKSDVQPVEEASDRMSSSCEDSPVPGTSKASGVCRKTLKEQKCSSRDHVEGVFIF